MWSSVQLSLHTALQFHDDGRTELVQTECSGHEIEGFKIRLTDEELDNMGEAILEGRKFFKPIPLDMKLEMA